MINITTSTQGTHKPLRRPCRCAVSLAKNASKFIPATTVAAGQRRWGVGEGLPEKMRTDCRIRNGSCYNDANDTSSQMLKFSVAPELPAPSTAVTADESFGSGSLPRLPSACLIFQYFAHKRRKLFFIFPPAGSLSMHPKAIPKNWHCVFG